MISAALLILAISFVLYVRLAPSDPAVWNVAISDTTAALPGPCSDHIRVQLNGARVTCLYADPPEVVLARLATAATRLARTTVLAGDPSEGRMTWVTRSKVMGFPDYTTAEVTETAEGSRLDIYARQRFGSSDWGVNAARLREWLAAS